MDDRSPISLRNPMGRGDRRAMKQLMTLPGEKAVRTETVVTTTTRVSKQSRDAELWAEGSWLRVSPIQ